MHLTTPGEHISYDALDEWAVAASALGPTRTDFRKTFKLFVCVPDLCRAHEVSLYIIPRF